MSFFDELKRRNVFRVAAAYGAAAWLVIQVASVLLPIYRAPAWLLPAFTTLILLGFPLALVFAWIFELTPEGLKRTEDVASGDSTTPQTGRKLNFVIAGTLLGAVLLVGLKQVFEGRQPSSAADAERGAAVARGRNATWLPAMPSQKASIAVLPFTCRSNSPDDRFFADGMHDELLTQLARIGSIKVISRTSVLRFRDTQQSIPDIASQLGVATVLEGSVQRADGEVRVNVQLIDAATDDHLWAEVFDRTLTTENLFAIQSELTQRIAAALEAELTPAQASLIGTAPSKNMEAYVHYLRGRQLLAERTTQSIRRGHAELEKALTLDPRFAPALVEQANALHLLHEYGRVTADETLKQAQELLDRALEIDPQFGTAYTVRAEVLRHAGDYAASEAAFVRAMELAPGDAQTYMWFALLREDQGRYDEELLLLERARELNPLLTPISANIGRVHHMLGRDEEALTILKGVQSRNPGFVGAWMWEAYVREAAGDSLGALRAAREAARRDPEVFDNVVICDYLIDLDAIEVGEACFDRFMRDRPGDAATLLFSSYPALARGDTDEARRIVRTADALPDPDGPTWVASKWRLRVAQAHVNSGDVDKARKLFRETRPDWFTQADPQPDDRLSYSVAAAVTLIEAGERVQARRLLRAVLARIAKQHRARGYSAYGYADVAAHSLLGDHERALSSLLDGARSGYLTGWRLLEVAPQYAAIRNDPRFAQAIHELRAHAAQQRERARREGLLGP